MKCNFLLQKIQNRKYDLNVHTSPLGPPEPTENDFLMRGVVMFGLEMLGLVHFDKRKCLVWFIKQVKIYFFSLQQMVPLCWCL